MRSAYICIALGIIACSSGDSTPVDAGTQTDDGNTASNDGGAIDAGSSDAPSVPTVDAMPGPDALPGEFTLTLSPGSGGSISVTVDSVSLGTCAASMVCSFDITAGSLAILSSVGGGLQHCTWTGDCAGTFGSSCFLQMDQDHSAGAMYDASDADCL